MLHAMGAVIRWSWTAKSNLFLTYLPIYCLTSSGSPQMYTSYYAGINLRRLRAFSGREKGNRIFVVCLCPCCPGPACCPLQLPPLLTYLRWKGILEPLLCAWHLRPFVPKVCGGTTFMPASQIFTGS